MDLELEGKRGFVGGASRGIGLAIARALLAEGADVCSSAASFVTGACLVVDGGQLRA